MKKIISLLMVFLVSNMMWCGLCHASKIGTWNTFLAYSEITKIEQAGDMIFVLASNGLYSYNENDESIQTYDKLNGLSDCNITDIAWCKDASRLVIVYNNYNIDLLDKNGNITNISEYYTKNMIGDKTINAITINGNTAYLSTGFGIVCINVKKAEISSTYNLGYKVSDLAILGKRINIATDNGICYCDMDNNPADKKNWTATNTEYRFKNIRNVGGNLIFNAYGWVGYLKTDKYLRYTLFAGGFTYISQTDEKIFFFGQENTTVVDKELNKKIIEKPFTYITADKSADNNYIIADGEYVSFIEINEQNNIITKKSNIKPDGPRYNYFHFLKPYNNKLYTSGGGIFSTIELNRPGTIQVMDNNKDWTVFQDDLQSINNNVKYIDIQCVAIDPKDENHVFAGGRTGLYEFQNGQFKQYFGYENSPLVPAIDQNNNYLYVFGLLFDNEGNLWCLNSNNNKNSGILCFTSNREWKSYPHTDLICDVDGEKRVFTQMKRPIFDSRQLMWFVNDYWINPALICYQPSTDEVKVYDFFVNEDGKTVNVSYVTCVAEDQDHNIWIGTDVGPLMLTQSSISSDYSTFTQVKVPRNDGTNLADYLLSNVYITSIAIDGAGRKWFGTDNNGVYLISADNMEEIEHFTTSDTPLLSNNIESIAIDGKKGEVFFGTNEGLCSYMSDATDINEEMTKDNVYAYPNPVKPDYTGIITVVGLTFNADVKIVSSNGTLVAEGRSNGGTFTWDGKDKKGKRVASGVYMVETATQYGEKGTLCKIAIVK
ncbi:MAG: two-component regulator propeller domain-containing protein [Prevotella sp.]